MTRAERARVARRRHFKAWLGAVGFWAVGFLGSQLQWLWLAAVGAIGFLACSLYSICIFIELFRVWFIPGKRDE